MELESAYVHLCIQNGILVGTYKSGVHINLEIAHSIVETRKLFTGTRPMPSLIKSQGVVSMDKPAREYLASAEATAGLTASAILVQSAFSSFLGNFFLSVNKTNMPVKLFTDAAKAKQWLRQFIE